jgi:hypothetical protein
MRCNHQRRSISQAQGTQSGAEAMQLENRTLDVLSAIFTFLAVNIKSETIKFGIFGTFPKFRWDNALTS